VLLEGQGLAILRRGGRYASLECGRFGGGHGHPDRLHLTLFDDGQGWLLDPGTGSYVSPDLVWYRSTLAHNAPRLDGRSQPPGDAECEAFDEQAGWSWTRGRYGEVTRTLVAGDYLLDVVELSAAEERTLELPWHPDGEVDVVTAGGWRAEPTTEPFLDDLERFEGSSADGVVLRARGGDGATLTLHLRFEGELLRASAPDRPGRSGTARFYLVRTRGRAARLVAALESTRGSARLRGVKLAGTVIEVETTGGTDRHLAMQDGWEITRQEGAIRLAGLRRSVAPVRRLIDLDRPIRTAASAPHVARPPSLDAGLDGFDASEPISLDYDDQYRRSEEAYAGPEDFSATVLANWDGDGLYLGIDVVKPDVIVRPDDAPPLRLDNEPDDIHADGVQIYLRLEADGPVYGFLAVPSDRDGRVRVRPAAETAGNADMVDGRWQQTDTGYSMALRLSPPGWNPRSGDVLGFDVLVNEMRPDRFRRAGQLVWSGGGGWVYLRGDRQPPDAFGTLELG
jgi:hypothetical protein